MLLQTAQYPDDSYYVDAGGNEYQYDDFIGKWLKKQKEKRDSNPKVIARREKKDEKRIANGKEPKFGTIKTTAPPAPAQPVAPAISAATAAGIAAATLGAALGITRGGNQPPAAGQSDSSGTAEGEAAENAENQEAAAKPDSSAQPKAPGFDTKWLIIGAVVLVGGLFVIHMATNTKPAA